MTDPYNIVDWINSTDWLDIEKTKEFQLASSVHQAIADAYPKMPAQYQSLWDQAFRSSQSQINNFAEACGKGMGWYSSALLIARGEAAECMASLCLFPPGLFDDKVKADQKEVIKLLSERIKAAPPKPDKNYRR